MGLDGEDDFPFGNDWLIGKHEDEDEDEKQFLSNLGIAVGSKANVFPFYFFNSI